VYSKQGTFVSTLVNRDATTLIQNRNGKRQPCSSFSFFTATDYRPTVLTSTAASPHTVFSLSCMRMGISPTAVKNSITERCLTGLEYMPWLKGGPNRWKWTEIILKSDKLIVNVVVFKLCNCIWDYLKCKGEINRRHYLLTDPRIRYSRILTWNTQYWFKIMNWKRLKNKKKIESWDTTHNTDLKSLIENARKK